MMKKERRNRYVFSLRDVNIEKVDNRYGLDSMSLSEDIIPENTTKLVDLDITNKTPEVVSFLDESKRLRRCKVSMINIKRLNNPGNTHQCRCFWDRNIIPKNIQIIGCPVKYIPSRANKKYYSEMTKDHIHINEPITEKRISEINKRCDTRLSVIENSYYETDGAFCSFNCVMAFIKDNKRNSLYRDSEMLLLQLYQDLNDTKILEITPAPHWRNLIDHGGNMTIDQFRESFNQKEYVNYGIITCMSLGRLYEERYKFS